MIFLITITVCALIFAGYVYYSHDKIAQRKAESYLAEWKLKEEKRIRTDAHSRSRAVSWGKTIEKFVPWMKGFPCNPRDAMFLAKPIDYLCFTERRNKKKSAVHFVEVKSGNANLSPDQEGIRYEHYGLKEKDPTKIDQLEEVELTSDVLYNINHNLTRFKQFLK